MGPKSSNVEDRMLQLAEIEKMHAEELSARALENQQPTQVEVQADDEQSRPMELFMPMQRLTLAGPTECLPCLPLVEPYSLIDASRISAEWFREIMTRRLGKPWMIEQLWNAGVQDFADLAFLDWSQYRELQGRTLPQYTPAIFDELSRTGQNNTKYWGAGHLNSLDAVRRASQDRLLLLCNDLQLDLHTMLVRQRGSVNGPRKFRQMMTKLLPGWYNALSDDTVPDLWRLDRRVPGHFNGQRAPLGCLWHCEVNGRGLPLPDLEEEPDARGGKRKRSRSL